jgi:SNF2 family DNA or RNA helicase
MIPPGSFDMLILDEAHKLRNLHGAQQAPKMAVKLQHALQHRLFKYVLMLTATPIHNRLWDLYSLISCLTVAKGHKNPLGEPGQFSATYIADGAAARRLRPGTQPQFREILRQYVVRTRRQDAGLVFPERVVDLFSVQATPAEIEMQRTVAEHIGDMNGLLQTSVLTALMSSPEALLGQLENMAAKNSRYRDLTSKIRSLVAQRLPFAKLQGVNGA